MHAEPPGDRNHALAVRSGSSNSVHLAFCQRCSSSSPRVRYDLGLVLGCILRLVAKTEFRLFPRGTQPLEPLPGVRFESTRVHKLERVLVLRDLHALSASVQPRHLSLCCLAGPHASPDVFECLEGEIFDG